MCAALKGHNAGSKILPFKEKLHRVKNHFIRVRINLPSINNCDSCGGERRLTGALSIPWTKVRQVDGLAVLPARDFVERISRVIRKTRLVSAAGEFFLARTTSFKV
jgi:hypothetical protein